MFNFVKKENRANKAGTRTSSFLKRSLVFGFVFLFISLPILSTSQVKIADAQGGADFRSNQQVQQQLENLGNAGGTSGTASEPDSSERDGGGWVSHATNTFLSAISVLMLTVTGYLVYAAGGILETAIQWSIIDLHKYIGNEGGIANVWRTFRDIANMFFIFILLYIAIETILGLSSANLKKMLARVIIVALLINFSFFFTKVVVDASNILSIGFYNQILQTQCGSGGVVEDIGNAFMCKMGLANLWSPDTLSIINSSAAGGWGETGKIVTLGVVGSIFILIAAFVFMAAAIMFVARFVTLIFLFMFSPLAFAAMAFPNDKYSKKWVEPLISNCILAPAYMAATWAVLVIIGTIAGNGGSLLEAILGTETGKPSTEAGNTLFNFVIIIALMVTTLVVAKQFGGYGSEGALKMLGHGRKWAQGYFLRNTAGRMGAFVDKKLADKVPGVDSRLGRFAREYTTGALAKAKFGGSVSRTEDIERIKKLKTDIADKAAIRDRQKKLIAGADPNATNEEKLEAMNVVQRLTNKDIDNLEYKYFAPYVGNLNPDTLAHVLEKSEKFNEGEKAKIWDTRFGKLEKALKISIDTTKTQNERDAASDEVKNIVKEFTDKEVELQNVATLTHPTFIKNMKESHVEYVGKSTRFASEIKKKIRDERAKPLKDAIADAQAAAIGAPTTAQSAAIAAARAKIGAELAKMKPQKVAKLDSNFLTNEHVMSQLTPAMLSKMPDEQDAATLQTIGQWIRSSGAWSSPGVPSPAYNYITNGLGKGLF